MSFKNLVEDENEARGERVIAGVGFALIILGGIFLFLHWKKGKAKT